MSRSLWLPPNGSLQGHAFDTLLAGNLAVLAALLVLAHVILIYALVRRRPSLSLPPEASLAPASQQEQPLRAAGFASEAELRERRRSASKRPGSVRRVTSGKALLPAFWRIETLPLLLCCALFAAMTITSERLWAVLRYTGPAPEAMQVEVVGVQFQWYFRYPGADARFGLTRPQLVDAAAGNPLGLDRTDASGRDDLVSSLLVLPAGREVDLRLRAHDVIHGFFIPGMRLKQNAVPGLVLHVHFTPVTAGDYPVLCTQVCGSGHARMQALLRVVPPEQYEAWIAAHTRLRTAVAERVQ